MVWDMGSRFDRSESDARSHEGGPSGTSSCVCRFPVGEIDGEEPRRVATERVWGRADLGPLTAARRRERGVPGRYGGVTYRILSVSRGCFVVCLGASKRALWRGGDDGSRVGVGSGNDLTEELAVGM